VLGSDAVAPSMPKMPHAGEDHGQAGLVGGGDAGGLDPAHLARADASRGAFHDVDDGVREEYRPPEPV